MEAVVTLRKRTCDNLTERMNTDWFYSAVSAMSEKGIISGNPDGTFKPKDTVTYGDFITMAVKAATGKELPSAAAPSHWSANYYDLALENKYFSKDDIPASALGEPIPRAYMALICSNILDNGPQKISFDPATDETKDRNGRTVMKEEKAREYLDQILATLKFYDSDEKYYMAVTFPEVPKGYQVQFEADIDYKQSLAKTPWWVTTGAPLSESTKTDQIPRTGTVTREIKGMSSPKQLYTVHLEMSINHLDDTRDGSEEASYVVQRDYGGKMRDRFAINRQGKAMETTEAYPYTLDRHFNWE